MSIWYHLRLHIPVLDKPPWILYSIANDTLVVNAENEEEARKKADEYDKQEFPEGVSHPWLNPEYSTVRRMSK
jgi:hypothetical protein